MAKRMRDIIKEAQDRRAELLKEFDSLDITMAEFAEIKGMTSARIGQILTKAREEHAESKI